MCSAYSAYIGVGSVVPTMMAANAYASRAKAKRSAVAGHAHPTINAGGPGCTSRLGLSARPPSPRRHPVSARTSNSALISGSPRSGRRQRADDAERGTPAGSTRCRGWPAGTRRSPRSGSIAVFAPDTAGEKTISTIVEIRPPYMLHSAPRVLNRCQYSEYRIVGRLAAAATANASATRNAMFCPAARMPQADREDADHHHRDA